MTTLKEVQGSARVRITVVISDKLNTQNNVARHGMCQSLTTAITRLEISWMMHALSLVACQVLRREMLHGS